MEIYGNSLEVLPTLPPKSVQCIVTSPPYYNLRNYGTVPQIWDGQPGCEHSWGEPLPFDKVDKRTREQKPNAQVGNNLKASEFLYGDCGSYCQLCGAWRGELGLEPDIQLYIKHLVDIFREAVNVLKDDGVMFINIGDTSSGSGKGYGSGDPKWIGAKDGKLKPISNKQFQRKSLMSVPSRLELALVDQLGLCLRNELHWHKRNVMPRPTKDHWTPDFEKVFVFTKQPVYKFNEPREPSADGLGDRHARSTLSLNYEPKRDNHSAKFPQSLVRPLIEFATDAQDTVLDPFAGTHTVGDVCEQLGRNYIGIELGYGRN